MALNYLIPRNKRHSISKRDEFSHPLLSFQQELNKMFEEFFNSEDSFGDLSMFPMGVGEKSWDPLTPRVDLSETEKDVIVSMELPGICEEDIDVSIKDNALTVSGEKKQERDSEEKDKGWYRLERHFGSFSRTVPLPTRVKDSEAEATFKNGVLTISIPKEDSETSTAHRISVRKG